jgi:hypothetical protein
MEAAVEIGKAQNADGAYAKKTHAENQQKRTY